MEKELLKVINMSKSFGPTKALVNVNFTLKRGEIHGLIGENGSGKSTMSSIVAGIQKADEGEMFLKGQKHEPATTLDANAAGICMLLQEQGTFDGITVAANIFAGKEKQFEKKGLLDLK